MMRSDKRRFWIAVALSFLAHFTALVVLLPIYVVVRSTKLLLEEENRTLWVAFSLAVLIHIAILLPGLRWLGTMEEDHGAGGRVKVDLWTQEMERAEKETEKTPEEELEEYKPEEEIPDGQVVKAPPSSDRRPPEEKPRFLAEQDSRVEREMKSALRIPGVAEAASSAEVPGKGVDNETSEGGMRVELDGMAPLPADLDRAERGEQPAQRRAPMSLLDVNIKPSMSALASALAGSGLDHLEDVVDGDHTALNTAGWRYAAFFNRVKSRVEQYWHPDVEYRRHDPYGNIYGFKNRITVLLVVLRGDGSLKKLYIMSPSGAVFLDKEAFEAVEKAAPFSNVPDGLKDRRDGLVKFTFHFIVDVGGSPVFRIRRYR